MELAPWESSRLHVFTFHVFTFHVFTFHVFTFHVFTFHVFTFHVFTFHVFTFHVFTFHVFTFHVSPAYPVSCHGRYMDREQLFGHLDKFKIETPSWGYADTGTRFGKF